MLRVQGFEVLVHTQHVGAVFGTCWYSSCWVAVYSRCGDDGEACSTVLEKLKGKFTKRRWWKIMTPHTQSERINAGERTWQLQKRVNVFTEVSYFYQGFSFNSQRTNSASKLVFSESVHRVFPALTICSTSNTPWDPTKIIFHMKTKSIDEISCKQFLSQLKFNNSLVRASHSFQHQALRSVK